MAMLAHHYALAGRAVPAMRYLSLAGQLALENSAYANALPFFDHALILVEEQ